jgi:hypothetical protein
LHFQPPDDHLHVITKLSAGAPGARRQSVFYSAVVEFKDLPVVDNECALTERVDATVNCHAM